MDFSLAGISIQQIMVFLCVAEYEGFAKASDTVCREQKCCETGEGAWNRTVSADNPGDTSDRCGKDSVS